MAASYVKYQVFVGDLGLKKHNLNTDTLKFALTNTAPTVSTNAVLADITEITAHNGYSAGGSGVTNTYSQSAGTGTLGSAASVTFTASGGTIGPFRYVVLYNSTAASGPLVSYWDYGSSITLNDTETFQISPASSILATIA